MYADLQLLGPLEVVGSRGFVLFTGGRRRSVFAVLALRPGRVVSRSSLIDALWADAAPATATKTLQGHIAQVRKALSAAGLGGVLVTREPGYVLEVDRAQVDTHRFAEHVRAGCAALGRGDGEEAYARLEAGLALWRGDPVADCSVTGWAVAELTRLHEARALAEEQLATALIVAGRHFEAVGEIERLVGRYPSRERLWELLMVALHRSGRQTDALRTYRRVRSVLVAEFGVEPGPELRRLEAAVLAGEPDVATHLSWPSAGRRWETNLVDSRCARP
ncbi:AfsR/SARP family transcriptional regulator [Amycolatopsis sp. H6(2020)]|nr:AfsR/SARP family transcriptional regulator [Amycolatopsis sp. H6(2020)]